MKKIDKPPFPQEYFTFKKFIQEHEDIWERESRQILNDIFYYPVEIRELKERLVNVFSELSECICKIVGRVFIVEVQLSQDIVGMFYLDKRKHKFEIYKK